MYPNGLTPDPRGIRNVLEEYAYPSADKWKIKETVRISSTEHTRVIAQIVSIGKKSGARVYVGKREQPERLESGSRLSDSADFTNLQSLGARYEAQQIERVEMIDAVWLDTDGSKIECVFEVENTTKFMSAIQRASNIEKEIPKFMAIPAPREAELIGETDPLFRESFAANHWRYILYNSLAKLVSYSSPSVAELMKVSKVLP